ncbi:hypothetical protein DFH11DRAFT_1880786 [Phellopilus nigrolimitatus]|nr:hypothetical protein DFH11DRAFT_1880786 [Phellopilus nigrolimitatus]
MFEIACAVFSPNASSSNSSASTYQVFNRTASTPSREVCRSEVLLVYKTKENPLPNIHGAPLRAIVKDYIIAHSCKWDYHVNALAEPEMGSAQRHKYLYTQQRTQGLRARRLGFSGLLGVQCGGNWVMCIERSPVGRAHRFSGDMWLSNNLEAIDPSACLEHKREYEKKCVTLEVR